MTRRTPYHILLVDDHEADATLTRCAFAELKTPINMDWVEDGVEALRYLRREGPFAAVRRPDVILLDLNMPRMDGRRTLMAMKEDPELADIPVVMLTVSADEADILSSYQKHAAAYIVKPIELEELIYKLGNLVDFYLDDTAALPNK